MTDFNEIVRRYGLTLLTITGLAVAAAACWVYNMPTWLLVICLIFLVFAVISLLGDLGLFGGGDTD